MQIVSITARIHPRNIRLHQPLVVSVLVLQNVSNHSSGYRKIQMMQSKVFYNLRSNPSIRIAVAIHSGRAV